MASISLRPLVVQGVAEFARMFGAPDHDVSELLVELIVGLSSYREEGLQYAPVVFVMSDLEQGHQKDRGSDPIRIGSEPTGATAARTALRKCAPLGEGRRWGIFIQVGRRTCDYGLFRLESSQLRPTSFEYLRRAPAEGAAIVGLTQLRAGVVEVRASGGAGVYFDFSGSPEQARTPGYVVQEFVAAVTASAPQEVRAELQAFYYRIIVDVVTGSHGALLAIMNPTASPPAFLEDGIWLPEPVSQRTWIAPEDATLTSESARALFAYAQLIRRMTMMDGITVLASDGSVRAYGCFAHEGVVSHGQAHVVGGARQRAWGILKAHVGTVLTAALYRSQDGAADCVSAPVI